MIMNSKLQSRNSEPVIENEYVNTPDPDIINNKKDYDNASVDSDSSKNYQLLFKIILIGDSGIGKTSIINRYVNNMFTDKYLCTIGVDFMMKNVEVDKSSIKLQIWDTAGMERYRQITTSYYRGANAAIIVFDLTCRRSFESLKKWISMYYEYSNPLISKSVVLVGNKLDIEESREVSRDEIDDVLKLNPEFSYVEVSAKSGENIPLIFDQIALKLYKELKLASIVDVKDSRTVGIFKSINTFEVEPFRNKKRCNC